MKRKNSKWLSLLLLLAMLVSVVGVNPKTATATNGKNYSYDGYDIAFAVTSVYEGAFNGEITITNTSGEAIRDWAMSFTFAHEILNIWNATVLSHTGDFYVVKNYDWNADIMPGDSVSFGFVAKVEDTIIPPETFSFVMKEDAVEQGKFAVEVMSYSDWGAGCNGAMIVKNLTGEKIENWQLSFDYNREIESISNAIIVSSDNGHYVIRNAEYNADIMGNASIHISFAAGEGDATEIPKNFAMVQTVADVKNGENGGNSNVTATPAPVTTTTPEPTAIPNPTDAPEPTSVPVPTEGPEPTSVPALTVTPIPTVTLAPTATPIPIKDIDFTIVDVLTLEEIYEMNTEESPEMMYNSDGTISRIEGVCANFKVYNSSDALKVVYGLQDVLSVCDIYDLDYLRESHNEYNDVYSFTQYYNGIEVVRGKVTVIVDADTKDAYIVNSYCDSDLNFDLSYEIEQNELLDIIAKEFNVNEVLYSELKIYNDDEFGDVLAWYVETDCLEAQYMYVDANTGNFLYVDVPRTATEPYTTRVSYLYDEIPNEKEITINTSSSSFITGDKFTLKDEERNIVILNGYKAYENFANGYVSNNSNQWTDEVAVVAMYNTAKVYDFYKKKFDRLGYDDENGLLEVVVHLQGYNDTTGSWEYIDNAYSSSTDKEGIEHLASGRLSFGASGPNPEDSYALYLETVAHEFTHSVTVEKVHFEYADESGAIDEAYSDIMGELIGNTDWRTESGNFGKNFKAPWEEEEPKPYSYCGENYKSRGLYGEYDNGNVHNNSRVLSHAFYLMNSNGISKDDLVHILYLSYDYYTENYRPTFFDCGRAIYSAAKKYYEGKGDAQTKLQIVDDALTEVNLKDYTITIEVIDESNGLPVIGLYPVWLVSEDKRYCSNTCNTDGEDEHTLCNIFEDQSKCKVCPITAVHGMAGCSYCCHLVKNSFAYSLYPNGKFYFHNLMKGCHKVEISKCGYEIVSADTIEVGYEKSYFIIKVKETDDAHHYVNCEDTTCDKCGATRLSGHTYTNCEDATCNTCDATRIASGHKYKNCEDSICNSCGNTRSAMTCLYTSCTDTMCGRCGYVRAATEHEYDDCKDTTCNKCGATGTPDHTYSGCEDATCNTCDATRIAPGHKYKNCEDSICNSCGNTRSAMTCLYTSCTDTMCDRCGYVRAATEHEYDDCEDDTCNICGTTRTPGHTYYNCKDTTCNNAGCDEVREPLEHRYFDCEDTTCENAGCDEVREAQEHYWLGAVWCIHCGRVR